MLWQKKNRLAKKTIPCKSVSDGERQRPWRQWHGQTKWIDPILSVIQYWQHRRSSWKCNQLLSDRKPQLNSPNPEESWADHTRRETRVPSVTIETESTTTTSHNQQDRNRTSSGRETRQWNITHNQNHRNKIWNNSPERQTTNPRRRRMKAPYRTRSRKSH